MFKLPQEVKNDFNNYKNSLNEFVGERLTEARFKGVRVPWGIYSQRGGKVYMSRIRIPAGMLSAAQLRALAICAKECGSQLLHITTRQDIQIHNVKIEDTVSIIEQLEKYELSPRGGGGNTVRNIITCPFSGVCPEEIFDIKSHSAGLSEYLLKQDSSFTLPRKLKMAFSGCRSDCAGVMVNDLGFLATVKEDRRGFKVFFGGGMGASSRIGKVLEEFIPEEDLGYCVSAVKNVFYKNGDRKDRHHNRLRFLVENIGVDKFRQLYSEELRFLKDKEHIVLRKVDFYDRNGPLEKAPNKDDKEYQEFLKYNVRPQKQPGYSFVLLRISRGDISVEQLTRLADLENDFSGIEFRVSLKQDIIIAWVKNSTIHDLFLKIKNILNGFLYPEVLLDVVACKGALTCNLGLCNSPALANAVEEVIKHNFIGKEVFKKLDIRLNGCPNACGQHPIGKISFFGAVKRVDGRPVPFYKVLLGGRKEAEDTALAREVGMVAAKKVPEFLKDFLTRVDEKFSGNSDVYAFLAKEAVDIAKEILAKYAYVPSYLEDRSFYIDWGRNDDFSLSGLGTGECGAGVIDMIEADLSDAKIALDEAENKNYDSALIKKAFFSSARALLIVKGVDSYTPEEAVFNFKKKFIDDKIASSDYADIEKELALISSSQNGGQRKDRFLYAKRFLEHINTLYKTMDPAFNFPKCAAVEEKTPDKKDIARQVLNLKGTPCPINYVKAKLALEELNAGEIIELILDEGEPIKNVPVSLKNDGHFILEIKKQGEFYRVIVKKS